MAAEIAASIDPLYRFRCHWTPEMGGLDAKIHFFRIFPSIFACENRRDCYHIQTPSRVLVVNLDFASAKFCF